MTISSRHASISAHTSSGSRSSSSASAAAPARNVGRRRRSPRGRGAAPCTARRSVGTRARSSASTAWRTTNEPKAAASSGSPPLVRNRSRSSDSGRGFGHDDPYPFALGAPDPFLAPACRVARVAEGQVTQASRLPTVALLREPRDPQRREERVAGIREPVGELLERGRGRVAQVGEHDEVGIPHRRRREPSGRALGVRSRRPRRSDRATCAASHARFPQGLRAA